MRLALIVCIGETYRTTDSEASHRTAAAHLRAESEQSHCKLETVHVYNIPCQEGEKPPPPSLGKILCNSVYRV